MIDTMPTPLVHLALAQEMLQRSDLPLAAGRLLRQHPGAFMLGHTAPDVRTISGHRREASHFYTVPRSSERRAHRAMFDAHPSLRCASLLSPPRTAFVAGYIAHLLLDELWLDEIFESFVHQDRAPIRERLFLHNVLRTWVDRRAQEALTADVPRLLGGAEPCGWLPFVDDGHLRVWRDWLVEQLAPDHCMETAEVLAERMGVPPAETEAVVRSQEEMERRVFRHFPRSALRSFQEEGYVRSVALVDWYLARPEGRQPESPSADILVGGPKEDMVTQEASL